MLKKFMKSIRRELLKADWVKRAVADYRQRLKAERHHEDWARRMHAGRAIRDLKPTKLDTCNTVRIVENDGLFVDYLGGRVVDQGYVAPIFIDSTNWGGTSIDGISGCRPQAMVR